MSVQSHAQDPAGVAAIHAALFHVNCSPVLGAMIRHRVPDHLEAGPLSAEDLARRAGLHALSTVRALRLLASFGVFKEVTPGTFANNAASNLLCDRPGGLRNFAWWFTSPGNWRSTGEVEHSLVTGESAWLNAFGQPLWEHLRNHSEDQAAFNAMFGELRNGDHAAMVKAYDWSGAKTVVDVGGGNGSLLATILATHSHLFGVLVDQPKVVSAASDYLASRDVLSRCQVIAGSFFDPVLAKGDIWILSQILHDWNDADCRKILMRCREQMSLRDRLLIIEMVTIPCKPNVHTSLNDICMLILFGEARQRTEDEYRELFSFCGLSLSRTISTASRFSIIEVRPV